MDGGNVTLLVAFTAGVLSFVSPCVLPLVPVYIGHMVTISARERGPSVRLVSFLHGVAFVAGFSLVFVAFWTAVGLVSFVVLDNARYLRYAAGAVLVFMGLHLLGIINVGILNRPHGFRAGAGSKESYARSLVMGMCFAAGWTPCIGPVLGGVIGLALTGESMTKGTALLISYSAGLGLPFLAMSLALERISGGLKRLRPVLWAVPLLSGLLVIAIGILMLTNGLVRITRFFDWGYV